jgi:hypothetical protein
LLEFILTSLGLGHLSSSSHPLRRKEDVMARSVAAVGLIVVLSGGLCARGEGIE